MKTMPDREKVIKGLECHAKGAKGCLFDCPYGNENGCQLLLCSDAIALLKEQEAVKPKVSCTEQRCGNCNKVIEMDGWKACPWCGKMIDWERWWNENGTHDNS